MRPQLNPDLPINCPTCGQTLEYVTTNAKKPTYRGGAILQWEYVHVYRCAVDGRFTMSNSEGLKPEPM